MKYRLKEIGPQQFTFSKTQLNNGTIVNVKYRDDSLEFQSPKMKLSRVEKKNDHNYVILELLSTQACKTFYTKILEIEKCLAPETDNPIKSVFNENMVTIKIPFTKSQNPLVKVYRDDALFNYYHLEESMEVICLLTLDKLWINNFNEYSYQLTAKEIMVTN